MKTDKIAYIYISACILLFISMTTLGQKIYIDENTSYWYNTTSDLHIDHNLFVDENTIHLLLEINFNNQKIYDNYHYSYELHESYHTLDIKSTDTIDIQEHIVAIKANKIFVQLSLPYEDKIDIAIMRLTDKKPGLIMSMIYPLIKNYNFSSEGLLFYEQDSITPHLQNFAGINQRLMLKSINPYPDPVYCFYYNHNFDEAVPPMVIESQRAGRR
jgi:hypothetical protein